MIKLAFVIQRVFYITSFILLFSCTSSTKDTAKQQTTDSSCDLAKYLCYASEFDRMLIEAKWINNSKLVAALETIKAKKYIRYTSKFKENNLDFLDDKTQKNVLCKCAYEYGVAQKQEEQWMLINKLAALKRSPIESLEYYKIDTLEDSLIIQSLYHTVSFSRKGVHNKIKAYNQFLGSYNFLLDSLITLKFHETTNKDYNQLNFDQKLIVYHGSLDCLLDKGEPSIIVNEFYKKQEKYFNHYKNKMPRLLEKLNTMEKEFYALESLSNTFTLKDPFSNQVFNN